MVCYVKPMKFTKHIDVIFMHRHNVRPSLSPKCNESSDPFNEVILPSSDMYTSNTNLASKKHDDDDKVVHAHV